MNEQQLPATRDEATTSARSTTKGPYRPEMTAQQSATLQKIQRDADIIDDLAFAASMASAISIAEQVGASAFKLYRDRLLKQAGDPSDPVERMMIEQLALAHHRVAQLHVQAEQAKTTEEVKTYSAAAARLTGEFRRLALGLRQYRQPISTKHFTVVKQQNLANGHQQVAYLDQSGSAASQDKNPSIEGRTEQASNRLTHAPKDDFLAESQASCRGTPEPQEARPVDRRGA